MLMNPPGTRPSRM